MSEVLENWLNNMLVHFFLFKLDPNILNQFGQKQVFGEWLTLQDFEYNHVPDVPSQMVMFRLRWRSLFVDPLHLVIYVRISAVDLLFINNHGRGC